jgi:hypothetical protein
MIPPPIVVVYLNWACTVAGNVQSSSAKSVVAQPVVRYLTAAFMQVVPVREGFAFTILIGRSAFVRLLP